MLNFRNVVKKHVKPIKLSGY